VTHVLWRQDDNGNCVRLASFVSLADAEEVRDAFEARGHKQLYWVESSDDDRDRQARTPRSATAISSLTIDSTGG
jgi:hypothetical protein